MIHGFVTRAEKKLRRNGEVAELGAIFADVQNYLGAYKQLPVYFWNNGTEHIVLKKRAEQSNGARTVEVAMSGVDMNVTEKQGDNS